MVKNVTGQADGSNINLNTAFDVSSASVSGSTFCTQQQQPSTTSITTLLLTGSPVSGVSHLSANLLDPVAAAVHRRRSSAILSEDATGYCRICRKVIMKDESGAHRCSNCQQLVCDDCSSYSSREESKVNEISSFTFYLTHFNI